MAPTNTTGSLYTHLECSQTSERYDPNKMQTYSEGHVPLRAHYDLDTGFDKSTLTTLGRPWSMWRYKELLPVQDANNIVTLGEGMTPMLELNLLGKEYGIDLYLKDEAQNPGNSFKSRGQSVAISKAKEFGAEACIIPTAGNAGGAMSAYCARAGMDAIVYMPANTPTAFKMECEAHGAKVHMIDGTIADCGAKVREVLENETGILDVSTFKEPFRLEGKKTMGYEIAEQMNWEMPDVVLYPTGGGTGLVGILKAVKEMQALGWMNNDKLPRMVAVQMDGCRPVVNAFENKQDLVTPVENPDTTDACGLRVPGAFAGNMIMEALYGSEGTAIAVPESELNPNIKMLADYGVWFSPESAALVSALKRLRDQDWIKEGESVLMLSTGGPYKYTENMIL